MTDEPRETVPAVTGVQPDAPTADDPARKDLAEGPPTTGEQVAAHPVDD